MYTGVLLPSSLLTILVPAISPELPLKVIFLPLGSMGDLATRQKYHKRFHLAYFSNRWVDGGGQGVVLAALDSYQTHTHSPLSAQYTYCMYKCTSVLNCLPFTSSPHPPHSMVHHLTDQLPSVMVEKDAVIVTETAKYVPSPVLSLFTCPHEAGHSTALLGYARLTYRLCSRPYPLSVVPVLCSIDVITATPPTVVMSLLQHHLQW